MNYLFGTWSQIKATGRSLLLDESDKPHWQKIDGMRHRTTVSVGEPLYQTGGRSITLGHPGEPYRGKGKVSRSR